MQLDQVTDEVLASLDNNHCMQREPHYLYLIARQMALFQCLAQSKNLEHNE